MQASDTIRTGDDGSVGITMDDDSLLSAGPNTVLVLDRYTFDPTTNQGRLDAALNKGTLAVISGPHRQTIAGCDDGAHADGHPRRSRHVVRGPRQ